MNRRTFLIGLSGTAVAGGALVGSGAFSRVESQRDVTVQVAEDPNAYLGLSGTGSPNSDNYVSIDDNGHLAVDISSHDDFSGPDTQPGEGVNSDSFTYFDSMVEVCNQGKEDVGFYVEPPTDDDFPGGVDATGPDGTPYADEPRLQFYTGEAALDGDAGTDTVMGEANAETVLLGECIELGVRVMTKGIDASDDTGIDQLFDQEVRLVADVTKLSTPDRTVYNPDQDEFFLDIQPALDDADPGDTVQVLTGTSFAGDVTIDTQGVTLVATSNHKPRIEGQVVVSADGATLDGFEVSPPDATSTAESEAIRVSNTPNNVTVTNNTVVDFGRDDPGGGFYGVDGINVFGGDAGTPVEDVSVINNEVQGLRNPDQAGVAGISVQGNVVNATVEGNDLSALGEGVTSYGFGVTVRGTGNHGEVPENVDVLNNTVSDVQSDGGPLLGVGLAVEADGLDYRFENNDIDGAELGVELKNAAGQTTLTGNSFDGTEIHLADVTGNVDLTSEIGSNDFGTAAATDDVSLSAYEQAIFPAIQPAIDASVTGAGVDVGPGTYDEAVDIDVADLTLASIQGPAQTTVERGVDVQNGGVTVDGFEIRNPGTQGSANPGSPGGLVGVDIAAGNEDVSVLDNVITDIGTGDDDANPIGVLASDGTSGVTVDKNEISNLEGTDEDQEQVQGVLINESGTQITDATVTNNTITGLLDTRSTNAVRFNGDVRGEITGNSISDLNTEGTIPGSGGAPGGFTQVIALQQGGGSATGPSNVTINGNDISNIETTTADNFASPVHIILGGSTDGTTVTIDGNSFSGDSQDDEVYVDDGTDDLDLNTVLSNNSFTPNGSVDPSGDAIVRQ
jgi:hypothetical protein